jgi:hypothetical protein
MHTRILLSITTLLGAMFSSLAPQARSQVLLNEIFENPPGRGVGEVGWEFLELYGRPGMSLDGCVVLLLKGGADANRDGAPEIEPQIDEIYDLTGVRLGADGFFTLVGSRADGESPIADRFFMPDPRFDRRRPESPANPRWLGAMSFQAATGPGSSRISRLDNHGSSTYVLARIRPEDLGAVRLIRGASHDADFDGQIDPVIRIDGRPIAFPVLQVLDEVAWSNRGGREYLLFDQNELSETHGFNPDALSRVAYYPDAPARGFRTKDRISSDGQIAGFDIRPTTAADEGFVYGVLDSTLFPRMLAYFDGYDFAGWPRLKGPTDQRALPLYITDIDPEPDQTPFGGIVPRRSGKGFLLQDIALGGFLLTPGGPNDHPDGRFRQFRFRDGDLNMDGLVDDRDTLIARALLGADVSEMIEDARSPAGVRYLWQGAALQQLLLWLSPSSLGDPRVAGQADLVKLAETARAASTDHSPVRPAGSRGARP